MSGGRPWAEEELNILRRNYPKKGAHATQARLKQLGYDRSINSIQWKGARVAPFAEIRTHIPLKDVIGHKAVTRTRAYARAIEDDVLMKVGTGCNVQYLVPLDWADAAARRIGREEDTTRRAKDWWTTPRLAEEFGLSEKYVRAAARRKYGIWKYLREIERVRDSRNWVRWNPRDAKLAIRSYHAQQKSSARRRSGVRNRERSEGSGTASEKS